MGIIRFQNDKILFAGGVIGFDQLCCCYDTTTWVFEDQGCSSGGVKDASMTIYSLVDEACKITFYAQDPCSAGNYAIALKALRDTTVYAVYARVNADAVLYHWFTPIVAGTETEWENFPCLGYNTASQDQISLSEGETLEVLLYTGGSTACGTTSRFSSSEKGSPAVAYSSTCSECPS